MRISDSAYEQCDDGNNLDWDGCDSNCTWTACGNDVIAGAEQCDDGNIEHGDGCSADCMSDETCGNSIIDESVGEQCDDGNDQAGDGCSPACALEVCGDGIQQAGEICDDGGTNDGDGCSANCLSVEACGNGVVDFAAGEQCDGGEYCNPNCTSTCNLSGVYDDGQSSIQDDNAGSAGLYVGDTFLAELSYTTREPGAELTGFIPMQILSCAPVSILVCGQGCEGQPWTSTWTGPLP